jgi:hypothetical protein
MPKHTPFTFARSVKVALSVVFVLAVAFLVVRWFFPKRPSVPPRPRAAASAVPRPSVLPLPAVPSRGPVPPPETAAGARIAIILDDWGYTQAPLEYAYRLGRPVTLSVLPNLPYSRRIAEDARRRGLGLMLHLPMQPKGSRPLEAHTIRVDSSREEVDRILVSDLASVPGAEGVNNHMGSAATSDPRLMRDLFAELGSRRLFFIDSYVDATTVGARTAREMRLPFAARNIFLDHDMDPEIIRGRLFQAARIALKKGSAVAIGHARKMTLEVLEKTMPEVERMGVRFVLARDLARVPDVGPGEKDT